MNILYIRYILSGEIGIVISIIGIIIALFALFIKVESKNKKWRALFSGVDAFLILALLINTYTMRNHELMPNVETLTVDSAKQTLFGLGFNNVSIIGANEKLVSGTSIVKSQNETAGVVINTNTTIVLSCASNDELVEDVSSENGKTKDNLNNEIDSNNIENPTMEDSDKSIETTVSNDGYETNDSVDEKEIVNISDSVVGTQSNITTSNLAIIIKDYEFFTDGFHYGKPISGNTYTVVDFDQGISGHFSYSRELTDIEYEKWGHGGKLLDESGQECGFANSFFSDYEGIFAVELSANIPPGNYVYVLYQFINYQYCEARISFSI